MPKTPEKERELPTSYGLPPHERIDPATPQPGDA
jgi:hypothetical protein